MSTTVEIASFWLARASKDRISAAFAADIVDGNEASDGASIVVISTRLPRIRMAGVMHRLRERDTDTPIVVVCHAGGEDTAKALVGLGATHVIAEGNEATLRKLTEEAGPGTSPTDESGIAREVREPDAEPLLSGFAYEIEQSATGGRSHSRMDPITGLPTGAAFSLRFADLTQGESLPRIAFIRIIQAERLMTQLEQQSLDLFRRRFVLQMRQILLEDRVEMFQLNDLDFAFIAPAMTHVRATVLGDMIVHAAEGFAPIGNEPLRVAIGHAGPEVANEPRTLRELAERAALSTGKAAGVVSGDELAVSEANSTEIDAMYALVEHVDATAVHGAGHHDRVSEIAMAIGRELGVDGIDLIRLRLAARLHDIGEMLLGDEFVGLDPSELSDEGLEQYRCHPGAGADYLALSTSEDVVSAVRHHHEAWDGSGFPDGLSGEDIPFAARVVAVANFVDSALSKGRTAAELCESLEETSEVLHDSGVVWAAITMVKAGVLPTLVRGDLVASAG